MRSRLFVVGLILLLNARGLMAQMSPQAIQERNQDSVVFISFNGTRANGAPEKWTGTGILLNERGFVLTNSHLVPNKAGYQADVAFVGAVRSRHLPAYPLEVIARDSTLDLALVKLPDVGIRWHGVEIANSETMRPGESLLVLGFPLSEDLSAATGILSSLNAPGGRWQTTVPLNGGNSGGPAFDGSGKVVAIAVGGISGAQLINTLIPVNYARNLLTLAGLSPGGTGSKTRPVIGACKYIVLIGGTTEFTEGAVTVLRDRRPLKELLKPDMDSGFIIALKNLEAGAYNVKVKATAGTKSQLWNTQTFNTGLGDIFVIVPQMGLKTTFVIPKVAKATELDMKRLLDRGQTVPACDSLADSVTIH